jgi:hypothetical protein
MAIRVLFLDMTSATFIRLAEHPMYGFEVPFS